MRHAKRLGLATTDLRDQLKWLARFVLLCAFLAGTAQADPVLSLLTQTQRLDAALVQEFEATRKVAVRVEFVSSSLDYEARIRSLPHNWDLVLADEQRLVNLSVLKVLRNLPESINIPPDVPGLERRSRANEDGRAFVNLMADPLGVMYLKKTRTSPGPLGWDWINKPTLNPLWRSRIALFADERMNFMTAAIATGLKFPIAQTSDARKVQDWLAHAELQGRAMSLSAAIPAFLAEKFSAGLVWQSDYLQAARYVKQLEFAVPSEGTYVERVGVGLVADCRNEALALDFIRFIYEKRDLLAQRRGLLPLHTTEFQGSRVAKWRIFSDDLPHLKELTSVLAKLKKDKDSRAARRR